MLAPDAGERANSSRWCRRRLALCYACLLAEELLDEAVID